MTWETTKKSLPEKYVDVLCFWRDHGLMEVGLWNGSSWHSASGDILEFDADPTHWMYLPRAPKEKVKK